MKIYNLILIDWRQGKLYKYNIDARTLTALDVNAGGRNAGSKWAGVHLKGQLELNSLGNNLLQGQVKRAAYGEVHQDLPNGWDGAMPQVRFNFVFYKENQLIFSCMAKIYIIIEYRILNFQIIYIYIFFSIIREWNINRIQL